MKKGILIAIEGIDGTGKSTQVAALKGELGEKFGPVVVTNHNSSFLVSKGPLKKAKKRHQLSPMMLAMYRAVDTYDRAEDIVEPALGKDKLVIADRWVYSCVVREGLRGIPVLWLEKLYTLAPRADLTVLLDLDPETALKRLKARLDGSPKYYESGQDVYPRLARDAAFLRFQEQARKLYKKFAEKYHWTIVDVAGSPTSVEKDLKAAILPTLLKLT